MNIPFNTYSWFSSRCTKELCNIKARAQVSSANSVVVLRSINDKYRFIEDCTSILGLGVSPGEWEQLALESKGRTTSGLGSRKIVVIDRVQMERVGGVCFINGDYTDCNTQTRVESEVGCSRNPKFNLILADVCPIDSRSRTAGKVNLEPIKSLLFFSSKFLSKKGLMLFRFYSQYREAISTLFRSCFRFLVFEKHVTSREGSPEMYVVCSS